MVDSESIHWQECTTFDSVDVSKENNICMVMVWNLFLNSSVCVFHSTIMSEYSVILT